MRRGSVMVMALVVLGGSAAPALGKGPVRATIEGPVRCGAEPGSLVTVAFKLESVAGGRVEPFGAGGIFVRLTSASGARSVKAHARARGRESRGRYVARVRVPEGGIRRVRVGLDGWRIAAGRTTPAPKYFRVANPPCG